MNVHKILCPVDFSERNESAIAFATILAKQSDAEIHFLYVYENKPVDGGFGGYVPPDDTELDKRKLEEVVPNRKDVRFVREFQVGDPQFQIVKYAVENEIDLIVLATHGRTGFMRLLMGSVAEAVVRRAPCPVVTVKHPTEAVEAEEPATAEAAPAAEAT